MTEIRIVNPSNPKHFAVLSPVGSWVRISKDGAELARSQSALVLTESLGDRSYPGALYIPLSDISSELTPIAQKSTHCPLKGDASYLSYASEEVAWTYDRPISDAELLSDYAAFYADRVEIEVLR